MLELNGTLIVQLLIFLAVMTSLNLLVFRPLGRLQERRDSSWRDLQERLDGSDREGAELASECQRRLEDIKHQVLATRAAAKEKIDRERDGIFSDARRKADALLGKERDDLRKEAILAREFLDTKAKQLAGEIFRKVMGRKAERGS